LRREILDNSMSLRPCADGGIDESELGECFEPELVVGLLNDNEALEMFRTATEPMTIQQFADECDVSQSTAYRKIEKLNESGLLVETTTKQPDGDPPARYKQRAPRVTVTVSDEIGVICSDPLNEIESTDDRE